MSYAESQRACEVLRELWQDDVAEAIRKATRGLNRLQTAEVLLSFMFEYSPDFNQARILLESKEALGEELQGMRLRLGFASSPHRSENKQQQQGQHTDAVQKMPRLLAFDGKENWQISCWEDGIPRVSENVPSRVDRLRCLGNAVVPQVSQWLGERIMKHEQALQQM